MDLDTESVLLFYDALKTFTNILYETSVTKKTEPGKILLRFCLFS